MTSPQLTSHSITEKAESFSSKSKNKTRMPIFATFIQHSIGSPSYSNHTRKRNKGHPNWKRGSKTFTFADDMVLYIENPVDSTKKLLDLIIELGKIAGYKVNIQKLMAFLYTNNGL